MHVPMDHPRVCGEKPAILTPWVKPPGSPPRVRGKACDTDTVGEAAGITPAYAGKSSAAAAARICAMDHPRVCREKTVSSKKISNLQGSPPRMRGKACRRSAWVELIRDHPRVCGEKNVIYWDTDSCKGSPPRVRGKDHAVHHRIDCVGITPAYAGKR